MNTCQCLISTVQRKISIYVGTDVETDADGKNESEKNWYPSQKSWI